MENAQVLMKFYWVLPVLLKIDAAFFEVNMTNYSQDIIKKTLLLRNHDTIIKVIAKYVPGLKTFHILFQSKNLF